MLKNVVQTIQIDGTVMHVPRRDVGIDDEVILCVDRSVDEPKEAFRLPGPIHIARLGIGPAHLAHLLFRFAGLGGL